MKLSLLFLLLTFFIGSNTAFAETLKTVTLTVDKMTCGACPITVRRALKNLDGVKSAKSKYEGNGDGWATVTYDADKIDIEDLTLATEMAGYPSRLKSQ